MVLLMVSQAIPLAQPPESQARELGVRMEMLAWSFWGLAVLLGCYALWIGSREIPEASRENWSPQALEAFYADLKFTREAGLVVVLFCTLLLFVWMIRLA
ncbi:MAG: hypothetical protein EB114_06585 [Betaproteobacteria bacterium]|nr:hypothetical protein [Betaproteobacteria bacterium]NBQ81712.1 hypothetical protein [Betaproteobacteria bacterium]NBS21432.1 hypothetical protein [Betaproteobacteria bacterium]NBT64801.1 hypothetical protein [Betaproteobacteria bacterium]NBU01135.1 hypothetical protein [Betaproteobacteria bacterium]